MDAIDKAPALACETHQWNARTWCVGVCGRASRVVQRLGSRAADSSALRVSTLAFLILILYSIYGSRQMVAEPWQWADDGLFLRQAEGLARWLGDKGRHWLGPYDAVLLSKPPLFAIWLTFIYYSGIPLPVAEFGLLLLLVPLFGAACRPLIRMNGWRVLPVTFLLVGLPFFSAETRLLRNAFQATLASACLIAVAGLALRYKAELHARLTWALSLGALFALCYLNREEAIWLTPSVGLALVAAGASTLLRRQKTAAPAILTAFFGAFLLPVATVATLNAYHYGVFLTTTRRAPAFTRAYQALTSLEPLKHRAFAPVVEETRLRAYELSPAFAELRPFLEGTAGDEFARSAGHLALNDASADTREFFVSNFEWALRSAAAHAGYRTAAESEQLFSQIAYELTRAAEEGKIASGPHGPALLAAWRPGDAAAIMGAAWLSLQKLLLVQGVEYRNLELSSGDEPDLQRIAAITHAELAPTSRVEGRKPMDFRMRRAAHGFLLPILRLAYLAAFILVAAVAIVPWTRYRRAGESFPPALAGLALLAAPFMWAASMGVVHVLGWPLLRWPAYQRMGLSSMSVIAAFGLVLAPIVWRWMRHWRLERSNRNPHAVKAP